MRVFWWQGGLHFEPQTDSERTSLLRLDEAFRGLGLFRDVADEVVSNRFIESHNEQPVLGVDEALEAINGERRADENTRSSGPTDKVESPLSPQRR